MDERERLAGIILRAHQRRTNECGDYFDALAAADAILADPVYARAAEMRKALRWFTNEPCPHGSDFDPDCTGCRARAFFN